MAKTKMACNQCDAEFLAENKEINRGRGLYCCLRCANIARNIPRIKPNWRADLNARRKVDLALIAQRRAHHAVQEAIKRGRIERLPCEVCKNKRSDAHHDDYNNPLDVKWLCRLHHMAVHK